MMGSLMMIPDSSTTNERAPLATSVEINIGSPIRAVAFTANGKYLVGADKEAIRVWRVADNQQMWSTNLKARDVRSIAVSREGKWIAAGKSWGEMTVWERKTTTLEELFTHDDGHTVTSVDFSPDSTRLVTGSGSRAASIWDIATRKMVVGPLEHKYWVVAAKFSPQGDRIATATFLRDIVRLYDSRNGTVLANIEAKVTPYYNTGLLWSNESIFVLSNNTIKKIDASTASVVQGSDWSVPDSNYPCIASPESGEFIVYSAGCAVMSRDTLTGTDNHLVELSQDAHSIAVSPDSQLFAVGGGDGTIVIKSLSRSTAQGLPLTKK